MQNKQAILSEQERYRHYVVASLHGWLDPNPANHWTPHYSQELVLRSLFVNDCKNVFVQCGRKWGKSELACYSLWRYALLRPNSACYYLCPQIKQAQEIIWEARDQKGHLRLKEFGSNEFIQHIDEKELRITFKNGSFIKVDGSDNFNAWAGISPNFLVLDEYSDFNPKFYPVMNPNRATFDSPVLIIGTPPEDEYVDRDTLHPYVETARDFQQDMLLTGRSYYIKRPSWDNPNPNIQKFLKYEKQRLERRGRLYEWWRVYGAELVKSGENKIFPHFNPNPETKGSCVMSHSDILQAMYYDSSF